MHGLCNVAHVTRGDPSHTNAAVSCHVDVVVLDHALDLCRTEPRKAKHANLPGHMRPVLRGARGLRVGGVGHDSQLDCATLACGVGHNVVT